MNINKVVLIFKNTQFVCVCEKLYSLQCLSTVLRLPADRKMSSQFGTFINPEERLANHFQLIQIKQSNFSHLKIENSNNWHEIINKTVKHLVDEETKKALNSTSMLAELPEYSYGQGSSSFQVKWI